MRLLSSLYDSVNVNYVLACLVLFVLIYLIVSSHTAGLSHVPGPFLARYTDAWRAYHAARYGHGPAFHRELHKRYGDVVRIGPKMVTVLDPEAIPIIYGVKEKLAKSRSYRPLADPANKTSIILIEDHDQHLSVRRPLAPAFTMSTMKGYEPYVDDIINSLVEAFRRIADSGEIINLSDWCHFFQFDLMSKLALGKPLGFIEKGKDFNGFIAGMKGFTYYFLTASQMVWIDWLIRTNYVVKRFGPDYVAPFFNLCKSVVAERRKNPDPPSARPDLISHFLAGQEKFPEIMTDTSAAYFAGGSLLAGGLSASAAFDATFRYLSTHPAAQQRLLDEIQQAKVSLPPHYEDTQQGMPYLDMLIHEAFRNHTEGSSFTLERVVAADGMTLPNGIRLPPKTLVGIDPGALTQREDIYGKDAMAFDPNRWDKQAMESEAEYAERVESMKRAATFSFGSGSRSCIGKNIAYLEMYKMIPTMVGLFRFEAVRTPKKFDVPVKVYRREKM